jgi:hypothetical protein
LSALQPSASKPAGQRSVSNFDEGDELRGASVNVRYGSSLCKNSARVLLARFSLNSKNGRPSSPKYRKEVCSRRRPQTYQRPSPSQQAAICWSTPRYGSCHAGARLHQFADL